MFQSPSLSPLPTAQEDAQRDVMASYALLLRADHEEYYDYLVKEGGLFHSLAWEYPEMGATFILPGEWGDPSSATQEELGVVITTLLFLEDGKVYEPKVREVCCMPLEEEAFDTYLISIAEELLVFRKALLALPLFEELDLPSSVNGRVLAGLLPLLDRVLNRVACKIKNWELMPESLLTGLDEMPQPTLQGVKYPLALSSSLSTYSRKTASPFTPYDSFEVAQAFGQFVSSEAKPSLLMSRKVENVQEAGRYAERVEVLTRREVLHVNELILRGVSDRIAGTLRSYECTVGDGRVCAPPAQIPDLLEQWLEAANRVSDLGEVQDRYQQIAELASLYQYIHPTSDGNGRTGHVVTNWCLRKAGLPCFSVPKKHEGEYVRAYDLASSAKTYAPLIDLFKKFSTTD